jgi:hypothetical protein
MRLVELFACGALLAAGNASAEYTTSVQHSYVPASETKRLAIVPFACPDTLQCDDFAAHMIKRLTKLTKLTITPATRTSEIMTKAGIDKLDYETGYILAEALSVDAFAVVTIQQASIETLSQKQISLDGKEIQVDGPQVKHVKLNLKLVNKGGGELLAASGEGHVRSIFSSLDEVATETFDVVLEKSLAED